MLAYRALPQWLTFRFLSELPLSLAGRWKVMIKLALGEKCKACKPGTSNDPS